MLLILRHFVYSLALLLVLGGLSVSANAGAQKKVFISPPLPPEARPVEVPPPIPSDAVGIPYAPRSKEVLRPSNLEFKRRIKMDASGFEPAATDMAYAATPVPAAPMAPPLRTMEDARKRLERLANKQTNVLPVGVTDTSTTTLVRILGVMSLLGGIVGFIVITRRRRRAN